MPPHSGEDLAMALAAIGDKGYEGAYNQPCETVLCVCVAGVYVPKLY